MFLFVIELSSGRTCSESDEPEWTEPEEPRYRECFLGLNVPAPETGGADPVVVAALSPRDVTEVQATAEFAAAAAAAAAEVRMPAYSVLNTDQEFRTNDLIV